MSKEKTNVIINRNCYRTGSRGVKEYYNWIIREFSEKENFSFREFDGNRFKQLFAFFRNRKEIIWSPSHATSILHLNHVVTVHDLINLDNCRRDNSWVKFFFIYINLFFVFMFSSSIVCISKHTQSRVHSYFCFFKKKTLVFKSPSSIEVGEEVSVLDAVKNESFVLVVSNNLPHKNNEFILKNMPNVLNEYGLKLVIVGVNRPVGFLNCRNVVFYEKLSEKEINYLFRSCLFICSPSLAEGHNIVLAKGNFLNKILLVSNIPVHKEYYPNSIFFDPSDPISLSKAVKSAFFGVGVGNESKSTYGLATEYIDLFRRLRKP